jgi:hypothetical protein
MTTQQNTTYRLRNWNAYSQSLKNRGNVTLWIDSSTLSCWRSTGYRTYTDLAIETCLKVGAIFSLPLRQTEGFLEGLVQSLSLDLPVPDYSTLSRRSATLALDFPPCPGAGRLHLVVDSTGLKVYGEGEWKVRQHGYAKRRTWVKLHLGIDERTGMILAQGCTGNGVHDDTVFPELLDQVSRPIDQVSADGAYDRERSRRAIAARGAAATIPPRKDALLAPLPETARGSPAWKAANERNLAVHAQVRDGYPAWAKESGYTRRAAAEWTMSRVKRSFGSALRSRKPERQRTEAFVRCILLNRWYADCRPESYVALKAG